VAGKGKTLFSRAVVGKLMGGHADAQAHLVGGSEWTENLIQSPVMRIDDSLATSDRKGLTDFTNRLKKYTANAEMIYNQKYKQSGTVPWFGRIIITCNMDTESLRILPDMDLSTRDKISLFRTSDAVIDFPDWQTIDRKLSKELPAFARFLEDWEIPDSCVSPDARFGVKSYHHPELLEESQQQGLGTILELLASFMDKWTEVSNDPLKPWEGCASVLYADLVVHNAEVTKEIKAHGLAVLLGKLSKNGYGLEKYKDRESRLNIWRIYPGFQTGAHGGKRRHDEEPDSA